MKKVSSLQLNSNNSSRVRRTRSLCLSPSWQQWSSSSPKKTGQCRLKLRKKANKLNALQTLKTPSTLGATRKRALHQQPCNKKKRRAKTPSREITDSRCKSLSGRLTPTRLHAGRSSRLSSTISPRRSTSTMTCSRGRASWRAWQTPTPSTASR